MVNLKHINKIEGGIGDKATVKSLAKKHNVPEKEIKDNLKAGIDVEKEHTKDKEGALDIAYDHEEEIPDYYLNKKNGLVKNEKILDKKQEDRLKSESLRIHIKKMLREATELNVTDETPDVVSFDVKDDGREIAKVKINFNTEMGKYAMELVDLSINDEENTLKVAKNIILSIFDISILSSHKLCFKYLFISIFF